MEKDQAHHESDLQRFFDNASHGVSMTTSVSKTDKVKLTIATDLQARKAGFRQIQLMDLYCLARGNEMWAIIPSIKRVGHDVDPLDCLHWRPCVAEIPEDVRPFWIEQSRAFGQKILAVISSAMRTELLAPHEHGVKKENFQASQTCGVSLYWVMVQLWL